MTKTETAELPAVGDFATYSINSDAYPVEVVEVSPTGHRITTRGATPTATGPWPQGAYSPDSFTVKPNPNGSVRVFTRRRDGAYRPSGSDYGRLTIGTVAWRRDPHF